LKDSGEVIIGRQLLSLTNRNTFLRRPGNSSFPRIPAQSPKTTAATTVAKKGSDKSVRGYTKKNGTHVQAYKRTAPNTTAKDNFSTKGNVNPYTGKKGTKTAKN
jgi:hypothetical protein